MERCLHPHSIGQVDETSPPRLPAVCRTGDSFRLRGSGTLLRAPFGLGVAAACPPGHTRAVGWATAGAAGAWHPEVTDRREPRETTGTPGDR